jgi:succinoglycan biosynthesis protein ExoM
MEVLVGIPTHKRPEGLLACLKSIEAQQGELPPIRVFVADNDPVGKQGVRLVDELASGFRFPISAMVVEEPGISAVRNSILDEAIRSGSDFIAMIDDDETASASWIQSLLEMQRRFDVDVIGGRVEPRFSVKASAEVRAFWTSAPVPDGPIHHISNTANCLISSRLLQRLGIPKFDPAFGLTGGGDAEWFCRVRLKGASFAWSEGAVTFENVPPQRCTLKWVLKRTYARGNVWVRIYRMHKQSRELADILWKSVAIVALSPVMALALPFEGYRWSVLEKWARAAGRLSAAVNHTHSEYAR